MLVRDIAFGSVTSASYYLQNQAVNVKQEVGNYLTVVIPDILLTEKVKEKLSEF